MSERSNDGSGAPEGVIRLSGELTIQHAARHGELLREQLAEGVRSIDLSEVDVCDSAGVQLLLAARRSAAARGHGLALVNASASVREILGRYALDGLLSAAAQE